MGKSLNHVVLEDPYQSPFVNIVFPLPFKQVYIGPLEWKELTIEEISGTGTIVDLAGFKEKPCSHKFVRGVITADFQELGTPTAYFLSGYRSGTFTIDPSSGEDEDDGGFPGPGGLLSSIPIIGGTPTTKWELTLRVRDNPDREWSTIRAVQRVIVNGEETDYGMVLVGVRRQEEPYSRVISISNAHVINSSFEGQIGSECPFSLGPPAPLDQGVENGLSASYSRVIRLPGEAMVELEESVRTNLHGRDLAIFDALDDLDVEGLNVLENIQDLQELKQLLAPLTDLWHFGGDIHGLLKCLFTLHLWWRYVIKTGILDIKAVWELIKWLRKHRHQLRDLMESYLAIGRGSHVDHSDGPYGPITDEQHAKLSYGLDGSSFGLWYNSLSALGFGVTLYDLWDLVPYSFVVDWFVPVGEMLDDWEDMFIQQRLLMKLCLLSRKLTYEYSRHFESSGNSYRATFEVVKYDRVPARRLPIEDMWPRVEWPDRPWKNTLTGTSLLYLTLFGRVPPKFLR